MPIKASTFLYSPWNKCHLFSQFGLYWSANNQSFFFPLEGIRKAKLSLLNQRLAGRPGGLLIRTRLLDAALLQDRLLSVSPVCREEQRCTTTAAIMPQLWWDTEGSKRRRYVFIRMSSEIIHASTSSFLLLFFWSICLALNELNFILIICFLIVQAEGMYTDTECVWDYLSVLLCDDVVDLLSLMLSAVYVEWLIQKRKLFKITEVKATGQLPTHSVSLLS